jgi:hypothetical protein
VGYRVAAQMIADLDIQSLFKDTSGNPARPIYDRLRKNDRFRKHPQI